MTTPSISVVIAVYNGQRWIAETLASLANQTFNDFEVVIIDDGSTDRSAEIIESVAMNDKRYRLIKQPNRGLVAALNRGIAEAKASFIARLDADDIAEPERFARQIIFLRNHPSVAVLGSAIQIVDENGLYRRIQKYPCGPSAVSKTMLNGCALAHPAVMMRREAVLSVGGYREAFRHAEDYDLWLRLDERHELDNLPEALIKYRQHTTSVSVRHRQQQAFATFVAKACAKARRAGKPDPANGLDRPIKFDILERLGLDSAELAEFCFEYLKAAMSVTGQDDDAAGLEANFEAAWELRAHLPARRFVRRCLLPYVLRCRGLGRTELVSRWTQRAFMTAPLSATWWMLKSILRGNRS